MNRSEIWNKYYATKYVLLADSIGFSTYATISLDTDTKKVQIVHDVEVAIKTPNGSTARVSLQPTPHELREMVKALSWLLEHLEGQAQADLAEVFDSLQQAEKELMMADLRQAFPNLEDLEGIR